MKRPIFAVCLMAAVAFAPACKAAVTVSGKQLMRDGVPWEPHGFVSVALVQAPAYRSGPFLNAYNAYSTAELDRMKTFGADTIRFQISQPGLDPDDTTGHYDSTFLGVVETDVQMALNDGFVVILSLQNENQGGTYTEPAEPNAGTIRVWQILAPIFMDNQNVIFEIMNEPHGDPTASVWTAWKTAHNKAIAAIRATGANNVVIADGVHYGHTLQGAPTLTDTLSPPQIAYSTHPYFGAMTTSAWNTQFGNFAGSHAVVNTEWGAQANNNCNSSTAARSLALLQYMHSKNVGLMAYSADLPNLLSSTGTVNDGKAMQTMNPWALSTFVGVNCGSTTLEWGPGKIISTWYLTGTPPVSLE